MVQERLLERSDAGTAMLHSQPRTDIIKQLQQFDGLFGHLLHDDCSKKESRGDVDALLLELEAIEKTMSL